MARILHLDDVEMIQDVVRNILEPYGHVLLQAPDGNAALRYLQADWEAIDLVLTDVYHPGASAAEVAQIALARDPCVPVIVCSDPMVIESLQGHFASVDVQYLAKPFLRQDLVEMVERALLLARRC